MNTLAELQKQLEQHFASLRDNRTQRGHPVYGLEHGLDADTLATLPALLSADLRQRRVPTRDHWLVWIVATTEVGYEFDGDEYWQTFAATVDGWREYGDRYAVRRWYEAFAKTYSGFRPKGRWARHFSIIAWPIAHSILPRDLQAQFARLIFDMRFELSHTTGASLEQIGSLLSHSPHRYTGSSRFEALMEETDLIGRLVLGLRDEDVGGDDPTVQPDTLTRIVTDLEQTQNAKEWLQEARKILRAARIRASSSLVGTHTRSNEDAGSTRFADPALLARERSDGSWTLGISIGDLKAIAVSSDLSVKELEKARVNFADEQTWMPARALLGMSRSERAISSLGPLLQRSFIRVEPSSKLSSMLEGLLHLRSKPPWLLRVQSDGLAREVAGNHVRANESYVYVATESADASACADLALQATKSSASDSYVYRFDAPTHWSSSQIGALSRLKLGHVLNTIIEPVGLVPRWNGVASETVWLPTEDPLLLIRADGPIREFVVGIDGQHWMHFPTTSNLPIVVSLRDLPVGHHTIEVRSVSGLPGHEAKTEVQSLALEIRSPVPWPAGIASTAGFKFSVTPQDATLQQVLDRTASISIVAAPGRKAKLYAQTLDANGHFSEKADLGVIPLPADAETIHRRIARLKEEPLSEQIQGSPRVDIGVSLEELGNGTLPFSQRVEPLRWKIERRVKLRFARLIDDLGPEEEVLVYQRSLLAPDKRIPLTLEDCLLGIQIKPPGALVAARVGNKTFRSIVSVPSEVATFSDLDFQPTLSIADYSSTEVPRLLALTRLWAGARPLGPLALHRKSRVLAALQTAVVRCLCGVRWSETFVRASRGQENEIAALQRDVGGSPGFALRMRTTNWRELVGDQSPPMAFATWASTYGVCRDTDLSIFVFECVFQPLKLRFEGEGDRSEQFARANNQATLWRGAYLAKLVTDLAGLIPASEVV